MVIFFLSLTEYALAQCTPALPGITCSAGPSPYTQTCRITQSVTLPPGTYSCTNIDLRFVPPQGQNLILTLQDGVSLTLIDSDIHDQSLRIVQSEICLQSNGASATALTLKGVQLFSPLFFLFIVARGNSSITVDNTASRISNLAASEIQVRDSANLTIVGSGNEIGDLAVRDTANVTLTNAKTRVLFLEADGIRTPRIGLSNIANGTGDPLANPPPVTFSCPMSVCLQPGQPCCQGTPYQLTLTNSSVALFRILIKNGGRADLASLGGTAVDFETSGGCGDPQWTFNPGDLPYVPWTCPPPDGKSACDCGVPGRPLCITTNIARSCTGGITYRANLTAVNVKSYAFNSMAPAANPDTIRILDPNTRICELFAPQNSSLTIAPAGMGGTQFEGGATACGAARISVSNADLSVARGGIYSSFPDPNPINPLTGVQIIVQNCTAAMPTTCNGAPCGTAAFAGAGKVQFGRNGDTPTSPGWCGRPNAITLENIGTLQQRTRTQPICRQDPNTGAFLGTVCAVCTQDDVNGANPTSGPRCNAGLRDQLVNVCAAPPPVGGQPTWTITGCQ